MSLFSFSTPSLPLKFDLEMFQRALSHHDPDNESGRRSSFLRSPGDDTAGEFHINLLMWELESQMQRYQEVKRQKLVLSQSASESETSGPQAGTSVSYEWPRRDTPKSRQLEIPRDARREIRELCRKTRPCDLDRLRATFAGVLAAKEPPPEDIPTIFVEILKSFLSDAQEASRRVGKFRAALNLLGNLRRLMKSNRVEPKVETKTERPLSPQVLGRISPCREHLFLARAEHLHCFINLENEVQPSNFALPLAIGERQPDPHFQEETGEGNFEVQPQPGKMAWQSSKEAVPCGMARKQDHGANMPVEDMEVIDLVSNSSSEGALLATSGPTSHIRL